MQTVQCEKCQTTIRSDLRFTTNQTDTICGPCFQKWSFATELTPIGEQYVIPGCERDKRKGPAQFDLWGK
jgi:hypothetical protein